MQYTAANATPYILAALAGQPAASVRNIAASAYAGFAAEHGADSRMTEVVQISRSSRGQAHVKIAYAAIAAAKRRGLIVAAGGARQGLIRLSELSDRTNRINAGESAAYAPFGSETVTRVTSAPAGSPREAFGAFMRAIASDPSNWTRAFAISEAGEQAAALQGLRTFLDAAEALLIEEGTV